MRNSISILIAIFVYLGVTVVADEQYEQMRKQMELLQQRLDKLEKEKDQEIQQLKSKVRELQEGRQDELQRLQEQMQAIAEQDKEYEELPSRVEDLEAIIRSEQKDAVDIYWKDGLWFKTADERFSLHVGGRILVDFVYGAEDDAIREQIGEIEDAARFRAARIRVDGTLYERFFYTIDIEFATNNVSFRNVLFGINKLPFDGQLIIGFQLEPFSLEVLTRLENLTFLERGTLNAMTPRRNIGFRYRGYAFDKRMSFSTGVFRDVDRDDPPQVVDDSAYSVTTRITGLPWMPDKKHYLHLGVAHSYRNPTNEDERIASRPEVSAAPNLVNTGVTGNIESTNLIGLEKAFVWGSFSTQAEAVFSFFDPKDGETQMFWGYYVFASYILTGESRPYNFTRSSFGRIRPEKNVFEGGIGAWEIALRYSKLDLNEDDIRGRRIEDVTFGVNWYLNPNVRLTANYIYSMLSNLDDAERAEAHLVSMRLHINF